MKVLKWLEKNKIFYNKNNTTVTVNGLRISPDDILTETFNSRKDGILCEKLTKKTTIAYYNKAFYEIYRTINN